MRSLTASIDGGDTPSTSTSDYDKDGPDISLTTNTGDNNDDRPDLRDANLDKLNDTVLLTPAPAEPLPAEEFAMSTGDMELFLSNYLSTVDMAQLASIDEPQPPSWPVENELQGFYEGTIGNGMPDQAAASSWISAPAFVFGNPPVNAPNPSTAPGPPTSVSDVPVNNPRVFTFGDPGPIPPHPSDAPSAAPNDTHHTDMATASLNSGGDYQLTHDDGAPPLVKETLLCGSQPSQPSKAKGRKPNPKKSKAPLADSAKVNATAPAKGKVKAKAKAKIAPKIAKRTAEEAGFEEGGRPRRDIVRPIRYGEE
jgi:hypothetical protein